MSKAVKASASARVSHRKSQEAEGEVLHFLTRTLQAHLLDAEPQDVLAKLQQLQKALAQQERTLSDWPDSPSKTRICTALAKAKRLVAHIVDSQEYPLAVTPTAKAS
jgi:hypothetical protein